MLSQSLGKVCIFIFSFLSYNKALALPNYVNTYITNYLNNETNEVYSKDEYLLMSKYLFKAWSDSLQTYESFSISNNRMMYSTKQPKQADSLDKEKYDKVCTLLADLTKQYAFKKLNQGVVANFPAFETDVSEARRALDHLADSSSLRDGVKLFGDCKIENYD